MSGQRIEDVIHDVLKDDAQKNALDFITFMRANEIPLDESEGYWEVKLKDECVCYILITGSDEAPGPWTIWSDQVPGTWVVWDDAKYVDFPMDEHIRQTAWANINICANCGGCTPSGGKRKTVLGKDFDNLCNSALAFTNPNTEALACVKKMIEMRIHDILKYVG